MKTYLPWMKTYLPATMTPLMFGVYTSKLSMNICQWNSFCDGLPWLQGLLLLLFFPSPWCWWCWWFALLPPSSQNHRHRCTPIPVPCPNPFAVRAAGLDNPDTGGAAPAPRARSHPLRHLPRHPALPPGPPSCAASPSPPLLSFCRLHPWLQLCQCSLAAGGSASTPGGWSIHSHPWKVSAGRLQMKLRGPGVSCLLHSRGCFRRRNVKEKGGD